MVQMYPYTTWQRHEGVTDAYFADNNVKKEATLGF